MWIVPLLAAVVAGVFAAMVSARFVSRRGWHHLAWALALGMFAAASFAVFLGVLGGWSAADYRVFWLFGAVLNVPFLAAGELVLLVRRRWIETALLLVMLFATAFAVARVRSAHVVGTALGPNLPSGTDVFRGDGFAVTLARLYSIPAYVVLVGGTVWSAWRMRRRRELRDRFSGTLAIALGATVVAAGSAFAATGDATGFSTTLAVGVAVMFWGFRRAAAARPTPPRDRLIRSS
jgi:hypothetical protein